MKIWTLISTMLTLFSWIKSKFAEEGELRASGRRWNLSRCCF